MKKTNILFILSTSLALFACPLITNAQSAVTSGFYYEPFDYVTVSPNDQLDAAGQGAAWWWATGANLNANRNTTGESVIVTPGNLTYPGLGETIGNKITITGTSKMYYRRMSSHTDSRIYSSFIFKVTSLPNEDNPVKSDRFVSMGNNTNDFGLVHLRRSLTNSDKFNIGLSKRDNSTIVWLNKELDVNISYFLVLGARHLGTINSSNGNYIGDSEVQLWLNPTGASNEDTPDISASDGANLNDFRTVQWVVILNNTGKNMGLTMDIDEIRSSTKAWSDVVPFSGGGTGNRTIITEGSLNYTGLTSSGNKVSFGGAGCGYYREFTGQSASGSLYGSFILNIKSLPTTQDYFIYLGNESTKAATVWLKPSATPGKFNIGIGKRHLIPATWSSLNLDPNKPYYIVFAYSEESGGGNDVVKLWVNPSDFNTESAPDVSTSDGVDISSVLDLNRVVLDRGNAGISNAALSAELDELKVSSSWLDLTALPVRFKSMHAEAQENRSKISWIVLSEDNNDYFEVQRSADGKTFEQLVQVKGKGTSNEKTEYTAYDYNPLNGINYYRLLQFDKDGSRTDLGMKAVSFKFDSKITVNVYPNPVNSSINLLVNNYIGANLNVELNSLDGHTMYNEVIKTTAGQMSYPLQVSSMPAAGMYILKITGDKGLKESLKIIIQ